MQICGVFVMGGVYADATPMTMPSIPNVLNRFSRCENIFQQIHFTEVFENHIFEGVTFWILNISATMNQLYHPPRTAAFFTMLAQNRDIPVFTITNNVVDDLTTFSDAEKKVKTMDGVTKFLASNRSEIACLVP